MTTGKQELIGIMEWAERQNKARRELEKKLARLDKLQPCETETE